jgi:hypothetical protein
MDDVEVSELPFLKTIFQRMYFKDGVGLRNEIDRMIAVKPISERSWRRLAEVAAELDSFSVTQVLLECGLPPAYCSGAMCIAARNNYVDTVTLLAHAGAPVNGAFTLFHNCAATG